MADYNSDRTGANIDFTLDKVDALDAKVQPIATGITVAGSLGIGTASPERPLHISSAGSDSVLLFNSSGSGNTIDFLDQSWQSQIQGNAGTLLFKTGGANERARIDSAGNLLVGTTGLGYDTQGVELRADGRIVSCRDNGTVTIVSRNGTEGTLTEYRHNGSPVGSISVTGSATSYNTSSDERLKENIQDTTHTIDIDDIQVREFDWKADGGHQRYGFIAQELETVYPEAVHSPEDADEMKSVDYSKLVPLLVKEIQQLKTRIEILESK